MALLRLWLIVLVGIVAGVAACSSSSEPGEAAQAELTAQQILTNSSAAMSDIESASFTIEQSGAEVFIDDTGQLGFQSAEGRFAAPASADALITVEALGLTAEVGAVAIDGTVWFTNPLSGAWTEAPENFAFDPATLFDSDVGFPAMLTEASATAELIDDAADQDGDEGQLWHHVRTTVTSDRVSVLTGGLVTEDSEIDLWVDPESERVVAVRFEIPVDDEISTWQMTLSDYDAEVTIVAPELDADG